MQFVPLYTSILRSRKVAALSDSLYRTWTQCLLFAQEYDHRGGTLPSPEDMSYALHMETDELVSRLSRLSRAGFLDERDGVYTVHDWEDWKHRPDPTAAARKRAQRERDRAKAKGLAPEREDEKTSKTVTVTAVTSQSHACHAPTNSTNSPKNTPLPPKGDGVDDEVVTFGRETLKDNFDLEEIGSKLPGWRAAKYPDPWIKDAILVANCSATPGRVASYINSCLRRWTKKGGPDPDEIRKARPKPEAPLQFVEAPKSWKERPA